MGDTDDTPLFKQVSLSVENLLERNTARGEGRSDDTAAASETIIAAFGGEDKIKVVHVSCGTLHTVITVEPSAGGSRMVLACGKGDFGELGYDADSWDLLVSQEQRLRASVNQRAKHVSQGGDVDEYNAIQDAAEEEQKHQKTVLGGPKFKPKPKFKAPVKQRRASFFHPTFRPLKIPPELSEKFHGGEGSNTADLDAIDVAIAMKHSTALKTKKGDIWTCGCYYCNEIEGDESSVLRLLKQDIAAGGQPNLVVAGDEFLFATNVEVASNSADSATEDSSTKVVPFAIKGKGKIGRSQEDDWQPQFVELPLFQKIAEKVDPQDLKVKIASGVHHCMILLEAAKPLQELLCFGDNYFGQLGIGHDKEELGIGRVTPLPPPFTEYTIRQVSPGMRHTLILIDPPPPPQTS